jgi:hypothetical protein
VLGWNNTTSGIGWIATSTCIQITGSASLCDGDDATSAGAGVSTIQENDVSIETAATTIDFLGADFNITSSPAGEANVAIDYTNSGITRVSTANTFTALQSFANASSTLFSNTGTAYFGGTATSTFSSTGALTLAGLLTANAGISLGTQALTGTTGLINYTNFDVDAAGGITVAAAEGLDTNGAGALELGKLNATSVDLCNSANCDTINIGNLATVDADTIIIGDSLDDVSITDANWSITGAGALTVTSCTGCGGATTKYLVTQHNISASTATEVTGISTTLTAGTYTFTYSLIVQSGTATVGPWFGVNYTGIASSFVARLRYIGTGVSASTGIIDDTNTGVLAEQINEGAATRVESTTAPNLNVIGDVTTINANLYITIEGVMVVSDGGDIELWHASDSAAQTSVMAGSSLVIQKITAGADLAEIYGTMDETIEPGDVVALDATLNAGVKKSQGAYDKNAFGVISTDPSLVMGVLEDTDAMPVMVAMSGRVPVKATTENGAIEPGDYLTPSSIPGVAMRATKAGQIIGQAMGGFNGEGVGSVLMFVKTDTANGSGIAELLSGPGAEDSADIGKSALTQLMVQMPSLAGAVNLSEITTDRLIAGLEVITPRIVADRVVANSLESVSGDLSVLLGSDGRFVFAGNATSTNTTIASTTTPVITFDALGNAFFAGEVRAGGLVADNIVGLEGITDRFSTLAGEVSMLVASSSADVLGTIYKGFTTGDMSVSGNANFAGPALFASTTSFAQGLSVQGDVAISGVVSTTEIRALRIIAGDIESPILAALTASTTDFGARISTLEESEPIDIGAFLSSSNGLMLGGAVIIQGGLTVNSVGSQSGVLAFMGDTEFFGRPYFTTDTAGFAVVKKGSRAVSVAFEREYLEQPVVNASISIDATEDSAQNAARAEAVFGNDIRYLLMDKSARGFTILLNKSATADIQFSWIALAVKGAKTFESIDTDSVVVTPVSEPTPAPAFIPEPASELISEPQLETVTSPEPVPEITPVSEWAAEPALEPAPVLEAIPTQDNAVPTETIFTAENQTISP